MASTHRRQSPLPASLADWEKQRAGEAGTMKPHVALFLDGYRRNWPMFRGPLGTPGASSHPDVAAMIPERLDAITPMPEAAVMLALLLQAAVIYVPFLQQAFSTVGLGAGDWLRCAAAGSSVLWLSEVGKAVMRAMRRAGAFT